MARSHDKAGNYTNAFIDAFRVEASANSSVSPMIGSRHVCQCCGRSLTITEEFEGHGPDDPAGYYYEFDKEPGSRWISASGAAVRFKKETT